MFFNGIRNSLIVILFLLSSVRTFSQATDLFISEYVEGSSSNKYIEIYNGTGVSVNLADYELHLYSNGSGAISTNSALSGTLVDGGVIVYQNSLATVYGGTTTNLGAININGDDAIALYKVSTSSYVDIFGNIGCDPGASWTITNTTINKTLVRKSTVCGGVTTDPSGCSITAFPTLDSEWDQFAVDVVASLGSHTAGCSSGCNITSAGLTNVSCDNQGTIPDATDDLITFKLNPTGTNLGSGYNVTVSGGGTISPTSGLNDGFATTFTLGGGTIAGVTASVDVTITDISGNCSETFTVNDPGNCSAVGVPTVLGAGNIAILGYNADAATHRFSFVLLASVATGTEINFTDIGCVASGSFGTSVGQTLTWVADANYVCGQTIIINQGVVPTATIGSIKAGSSDLSLNTGDQIIAYQGSPASPTFLYAVNFNVNKGGGSWDDGLASTNVNESALPTGLADGFTAVALSANDNGRHSCITAPVGIPSILSSVSNSGNWVVDKNNIFDLSSICAFECDVAPTKLLLTVTAASCLIPGDPFNITVCAVDVDNNTYTNYSGDITISVASGSGNLTGTLTQTAVSGCANFSNISVDVADTYTFNATETTVPISGSSSALTVMASCSAIEGLIINEVSNGTEQSKEYYEFIVAGNCGTSIDIGGIIIDDNNGDFTNDWGSSSGIATGHMRLSTNGNWSSVPVGSIILLYNNDIHPTYGSQKNPQITASDDLDDTGVIDSIYILPHDNTSYIDKTTDLPKWTSGYVYSNTLYSPVDYTDLTLTSWNSLGIRNGGDAVQTRGVDGSYFHGISYGSNMTGGPDNLYLGTSGTDTDYSFTRDNFRDAAQWVQHSIDPGTGGTESLQTPGTPNNAENSAWIAEIQDPTIAGCPFILPIVNIELSYIKNKSEVILNWETIGVLEEGEFLIQRLNDMNYETISIIKSSEKENYNFTDYPKDRKEVKYRIVFKNINNRPAVYSNIISVRLNKMYVENIYPNPAQNNVNIKLFYDDVNSESVIEVYNVFGEKVISKSLEITQGINEYKINTTDLPNGLYTITISTSNQIIINKLTITK